MNKFLLPTIISIFVPVAVFAQKFNLPLADDGFAYASLFAGNFSLLLSIVIGIIANFIVFRAARKLCGGLFGLVLNYIGIGMSLIVLGTILSILSPWFTESWLSVISTVFFATGYIFMVIGANRLFKGIMNT